LLIGGGIRKWIYVKKLTCHELAEVSGAYRLAGRKSTQALLVENKDPVFIRRESELFSDLVVLIGDYVVVN
jgi:hypothetical protein